MFLVPQLLVTPMGHVCPFRTGRQEVTTKPGYKLPGVRETDEERSSLLVSPVSADLQGEEGLRGRDRWEGLCGPHALALPSWLTCRVSSAVRLEVLRHQPVAHGPALHVAVLRAHGHRAHVQVPPPPPPGLAFPICPETPLFDVHHFH